jgi:hypothetical protein
MASGGAGFFRLSWSRSVLLRTTILGQLAMRRGVIDQFLADMETTQERLTLNPIGWGDPLYHYHHLDLTVYRFVLSLVRVLYAVDPVRRVVYIKEISPVPGRALDA